MSGSLLHSLPAIVDTARHAAAEAIEQAREGAAAPLEDRELVAADADAAVPDQPNRLIRGDNLRVAAALLAGKHRLTGQAALVYIDPPFDSRAQYRTRVDLPGRVIDHFAYSDTWTDGTASYLAMLAPRLVAVRELLAPGGSLYVHLDHRVGHYVKVLLDEILGRDCFVNEIVWQGAVGDTSAKNRKFIKSHDVLYLYRRAGGPATWNDVFQDYGPASDRLYHRSDALGRYRLAPVDNPGGGGYVYDLELGEKPPKNGYRMPRETALQWLADGMLVVEPGRVPGRKLYRSPDGVRCRDVWSDIPSLQSAESVGYATQKPERLLERIISSSTDPGDLVVDLFAGSGTTAVVAERLGRRWVVADLGDPATMAVRRRLLAQEARPFLRQRLGGIDDQGRITVEAHTNAGELSVALREYAPPSGTPDIGDLDPLALIDGWAVGAAPSPDRPFRAHWQVGRDSELRVPTEARLEHDTGQRVAVQAIDVFGHECRVEVDLD